ncbi:MAG: penicillin-binding protein, partial [Chloroflexi bacterium]
AILRVEDGQGRTLKEYRPRHGERVLDERVAYLITDILSDDAARTPAFGEGSVLKLSRPAAVKTGTTTDWRDNWTVGYTPDLVVGVWAGNPDNSPMRDVSGVTGAAPIWHDFMEEVLKGRPVRPFVEPEGMVHVEVCALSGKLPNPYCPHRRREVFIAGTEPKEMCTMHQLLRLDAATGQLATPDTPPERVVERVYTVLPAEAVEWGRERGLAMGNWLLETGSWKLETSSQLLASSFQLVITSPDQGDVYRLSPALPPSEQRIEVAVRPGEGMKLAEVTLYVDGRPLARLTAPPYRAMWPLAPGVHRFAAVGRDGAGNAWQSQPVRITVLE